MEYLPRLSHFGDRKSSSGLQFEAFVPPSAWTEDQTCHYLLFDLPGFKKQELKLEVADQTHIVVSGERQVSENKYKRFEQRFELPTNADREKITGKLDGEILYISVPKKVEEHHEIKHGSVHSGKMDMLDPTPTSTSAPTPAQLSDVDENGDDEEAEEEDDDDDKSDQNEDERNNKDGENHLERKKLRRGSDEDWGYEADSFLRLAIEKLRTNKGIVVTAIFAFSFGVLVSQKFQSNGQ